MKRAMSLLVALAAVLSTLTLSSFAATGDEIYVPSSLEFASGSTDKEPLVTASRNDMVLSLGTSRQMILPETHLTPGTEYEYKIFKVTADANGVAPEKVQIDQLTGADLNGGTLRVRSAKGSSAMSNVSIKKRGSGDNATYNLVVETRTNYGTKMTDVEYTLTVSGQSADSDSKLINNSTVTFDVGYRSMRDEDIESYGEGDIITIEQNRPVITRSQFSTLARAYNYKPVEFVDENGEWSFIGRISGMGDTNFVTSYDVVDPIINKLPDQDYKFVTFNAGVNFPTNGEMRIDVSDISDSFTKIYTYLYRNGTLTPIATSYDSGADEIVFRTNYLGAFVLTDVEITDTDILDPDVDEPGEGNNNGGNTTNPDTGARNVSGAAVAVGIATLAAAGIVIRKRK